MKHVIFTLEILRSGKINDPLTFSPKEQYSIVVYVDHWPNVCGRTEIGV
jgi:hypothetical protein